jgi:tRNA1(Val) A37 N6-methylase TrmN6
LEELLWPGVRYCHAAGAFPLGTDAFALAGFAAPPPTGPVADLGCGCGVVGLLLAGRLPGLRVTGIELDRDAAAMAAENAARNGMTDRFSVICGDLRQARTLLPMESFRYAVANPPYFPTAAGAQAPEPGRRTARSEAQCTLEDVCQAARWLVQFGGGFALVHRPERLTDLFCTLRQAGFEPKRLRLVCHRPGKAASLVLVEAKKGGKPGLRLEPDLLLHDETGRPTAEHRRLYGNPPISD